jgi:hypothetical protein
MNEYLLFEIEINISKMIRLIKIEIQSNLKFLNQIY